MPPLHPLCWFVPPCVTGSHLGPGQHSSETGINQYAAVHFSVFTNYPSPLSSLFILSWVKSGTRVRGTILSPWLTPVTGLNEESFKDRFPFSSVLSNLSFSPPKTLPPLSRPISSWVNHGTDHMLCATETSKHESWCHSHSCDWGQIDLWRVEMNVD